MRVLIAEDDAVSRELVFVAVNQLGHRCTTAVNGLEAWKILQEHEFDVVISDWMMPEMDGLELCRRAREGSDTASHYQYFIFLTGMTEREQFLEAMNVGADDYLIKPLNPMDLRVRLNVAERVTSLYSEVVAQRAELQEMNEGQVQLLAAVARSLEEGICAFTPDGRITAVNRAATEMLAARPEELRSLSIADISPEVLDGFLRSGRSIHRHGIRFRRHDGSTFPVDYVCSPLSDHDRSTGAVVAFRDITDELKIQDERARLLKQEQAARAEAEVALGMRDEFLSLASHELKTPLAILQLQIQALRQRLPAGGMQKEALENIEKQIRRLTRLGTDMIAVSMFDSGPIDLHRRSMDVVPLVQKLVGQFRGEAAATRTTLKLCTGEPVPVDGDTARLEYMLTHLLSNALKYGAGTTIEITADVQGPFGRIAIRDEGQGLSIQDQTRVFDRFVQAGGKAASGLGLGLYIAHRIAEAHGGTIQVMSEPGKGATFTVLLPVADVGRPTRQSGRAGTSRS